MQLMKQFSIQARRSSGDANFELKGQTFCQWRGVFFCEFKLLTDHAAADVFSAFVICTCNLWIKYH
jgi:hypothetical protein